MRKLFLPLLLIFVCASVYARTLTFELQPKFSYYNGSQGEYVYQKYYDKKSDEQTAKLSQLDWDLKNVFCLGVDFKMSAKNWHWSYDVKTAVPKYVGIMADYDWKNVQYLPEIDFSYADMLTNYTESKNRLNLFVDTNAKVGYKFSPDNRISFAPFFELGYRFLDMSAFGLKGAYGNKVTVGVEHYDFWDSLGATVKNEDEKKLVINYQQNWIFTWLGLETVIQVTPTFAFGVTFAVSPFLLAYSIDTHVLRDDQFHDVVGGFFQGGYIDFFIEYGFTQNDFINLGVNLSGTAILKGKTYFRKTFDKNLGLIGNSLAGEDFKSLEITLGYKRRF